MTGARANEIVRMVFYKHLCNLESTFSSKNSDSSEIAFNVGRYVGMMQKDLENELAKEIDEHDGE